VISFSLAESSETPERRGSTDSCSAVKLGSSPTATNVPHREWTGTLLSCQSIGQDGGMPVVIFVGSCKTLSSARSELVMLKGESIAGGPRSSLRVGAGGGMLIGEDGNGTMIARSLLVFSSLVSGDIVLLRSCELRTKDAGSRGLRKLDALLPLLRKMFDTLPRPEWRECRLRVWRRDAATDFEVDIPSRPDCLFSAVHLSGEPFDLPESATEVLWPLSVFTS
jgi:hypothetical protein